MPQGIIKKIVRASLSVPGPNAAPEYAPAKEGYGIIRTTEGREVFFVHSAVVGDRFNDLRQGLTVEFVLEEGPLGLATSVVPDPSEISIPAG